MTSRVLCQHLRAGLPSGSTQSPSQALWLSLPTMSDGAPAVALTLVEAGLCVGLLLQGRVGVDSCFPTQIPLGLHQVSPGPSQVELSVAPHYRTSSLHLQKIMKFFLNAEGHVTLQLPEL